MGKRPLGPRFLRRIPEFIALGATLMGFAWVFSATETTAAAAPLPIPGAAPLVPLPTLISPIYTDTYEINNGQATAFNLNPGFPYGSIPCGDSPLFTDTSPLIANATFWQWINPSFDTDWYNIELFSGHIFTVAVRNKVPGSPIIFNVQLRSPSNANIAPAPLVSAAPDLAFYTTTPGRYQLGLAVFFATTVGNTENYPYDVYVCSAPAPAQSATLGGRVWFDASRNGLQGGTEPGMPGIAVTLLTVNGMPLSATVTGANGAYAFTNLVAGTYVISVTAPEKYSFAEQDVCGAFCDPVDSDVDIWTGATPPILLGTGETNLNIAAGLIRYRFDAMIPIVNLGAFTDQPCNSSSPYWMAVKSGNPTYTFCSKQDLEWNHNPVVTANLGETKDLTLRWNIFGIGGIRLRVDPAGNYCGGIGGNQGSRDVPVNGSDGPNDYRYPMNANEFGRGGYKFELFIINQQGQTVGYNEKFLCVN